jgi:glycosyltransferase involved in cell wall biosynthesis
MRGGEKVLELLCELLPGSDLYTLIHVRGRVSPYIEDRRILASWLNRLPGVRRYYRYLLPLMPWTARQIRLRDYDLVVAVSHCVAHGVDVAPGARFVCYCNTPMRYAWGMLDSYFPRRCRFDPRYWLLRGLGDYLREWDRRAAQRVGEYIANSRNVQQRILECYGRKSTVVHPPVDTDYYRPAKEAPGDFYLWVGALAPYKRVDLALEAFGRLDRRLIVIGEGQLRRKARRTAPPNVTFLGWQPDEVLRRHFSACRALIFPGEEDFGIVPVEAQSCGSPVIALAAGGALETVVDLNRVGPDEKPTGVLFGEPTADGLVGAVRTFERNANAFEPEAIRAHALRFSRQRCRDALDRQLLGARQETQVC